MFGTSQNVVLIPAIGSLLSRRYTLITLQQCISHQYPTLSLLSLGSFLVLRFYTLVTLPRLAPRAIFLYYPCFPSACTSCYVSTLSLLSLGLYLVSRFYTLVVFPRLISRVTFLHSRDTPSPCTLRKPQNIGKRMIRTLPLQ